RLHAISAEFRLPIISIESLIHFRRRREKLVERAAEAEMPTRYGRGRLVIYQVKNEPGNEPVAFVMGDLSSVPAPLVRMHSSCFTGHGVETVGRSPTTAPAAAAPPGSRAARRARMGNRLPERRTGQGRDRGLGAASPASGLRSGVVFIP